jgi:hypothetical protein
MDNPDAPINLIHQADCIGIILKIIEKSWEKLIMQPPLHPFMREVYYTKSIGTKFSSAYVQTR